MHTTACSGFGAKNRAEKCIYWPYFLGCFIDDIEDFDDKKVT
jgi:hypothetical protein